MNTRTAPHNLYVYAAYVVEPHKGDPTDYYRVGDPVIVDTLGWHYWPDVMPAQYAEGFAQNRTVSMFTAEVAEWGGEGPRDDGSRIGAVLAKVSIPDNVRSAFEASKSDDDANAELNDWMDYIEWQETWVSPVVKILKETTAFRENRERIIAVREAGCGVTFF